MSQHTPASSAFELHGATTDVTYRPGEHLEVRDEAGLRVYSAHGLTVEPVSLGHLVTAQLDPVEPDTTFSLLLAHVPPGGGHVSAVAITARPKSAVWKVVAMEGQAGANATRAAREAAVRSVSTPSTADAAGEQGRPGGKAGALAGAAASALSVNVAVDQLVSPAAADAAAPATDAGGDLPVPNDGVTLYAHVGNYAPVEDDVSEPDAEDEQGADEADDDFLGGFGGGGPHFPHDLI